MTKNITFSIIVPIYNVEGMLRGCIDSILSQTYKDFELIAVEDCSTDNSRRLVNELAKENDFKVVELERNGGLANARNEGVKYATGDYVIYIDSDDQIESQLLQHIVDIADESDIVIFNHYRYWLDGGRRNNLMTPLLKELSLKPILNDDIERKIRVFSNLNVAWNKAYKREFIVKNNLFFDDGYYEDITFNYKAIVFADKIKTTPYLGYAYLQRDGSILNSRSDKHKDLTLQYDRLYRFITDGQYLEYFAKVDQVFVDHLLNLLINQERRLTTLAKNSLLSESKRIIEEYNVKERVTSGPLKTKMNNLISLGNSFSRFSLITNAKAKAKSIFATLYNPTVQQWKVKVSMAVKRFMYHYIFISLPVNEKLAVFEAYWGRSYSCSPKSISKFIEENSDIETVWFGKSKVYPCGNSECVKINSLKYFYYLATAKYVVANANFPNFVVKRKGSVHVQTKHGTPLKLMGFDELAKKEKNKGWFAGLTQRSSRWDYVLSSNKYSSETWRKSFPFNFDVLEYGYPRNDFLVNNRDNTDLVQRIRGKLGIPESDKRQLLLFMPTFRDYHKVPDYFLDFERFIDKVSDKFILMTRAHYFLSGSSNLASAMQSLDVTEYPKVEELYLAADVMITDYSSSMFDYGTLQKPTILYLPDYEEYASFRGMYFDIRDKAPGYVAETEDELIDCLVDDLYINDECNDKLLTFHDEFCSFDDGKATENVCKKIFNI